MSYLLGIDVGTTRTAAAICRQGSREAEIVNLGDRSSAVPSVLFLGTDGSVLVGDAAERRAVTDPDRVVREFKRRIGDPTPLNVAGRAWPAQELAARLVRWVVDRVAEREGGPATRIAVTHPASWGTHKKDLLGAALAGQGLKVVFLAEPQAAALHYASAERVERGSTIAVYDLGGGTFDAAVVHKDNTAGFTLVGRPEGLENLGGIDFDQAVFDHVRDGIPGAFDALDDADPAVLAAVARVRRDCTEAKEALSADTEVSIPVILPEARGSVRLHRSEFEQMIRPQIEETVAALRRAIGSAGFTPEQLSAVLLVGGSSRVPLVSQLVSEELGRPVAVDADPKNAIAKGAALALTPNAGSTGANPAHEPSGDTGKTRPVSTGAARAAGYGAAGAAAAALGTAGPGGIAAAAHGGAGVPPAALAPGTGAWGDVPTQRAVGGTGAAPPPRPYQPALPPHTPAAAAAPATSSSSRGSSPAALITIGGLFAAAIVVAALLLLPRSEPTNTNDQSPITTAPASTIPPVVAPPQQPEETTTRPAPQTRTTPRPAPTRTTPPVVPPPVTSTTTPAPTTTTSAPPTDPPTETSTPPPDTEPPPETDGGSSSAAGPSTPPDGSAPPAGSAVVPVTPGPASAV